MVRTSIGNLSEGTRKRLTLAACILGSTIVFIDSSVVTVALPAMERDLGGGLALQQWVADAYLLTLGSLILVGGSLGDLFGQRRIFVIGVVSFAVTSVLCAVAWDEGSLIAFRAAQGVAGALLTPASLATISVLFEGEERGAAIGSWTAWTGISFLIGPLVGGWLVSAVSWRGIFLINVPVAIATLALIAIAIPPIAAKPHARVDVLGGVLCALGLAGPVYALIEAPSRGFSDPLILATLLGGIALFGLFLLWEARSPNPMLPLRLFRRRNFSFANLETFTVYGALATQGFFLTLFLQQLAGYSALQAGATSVPVTVVMFLLSPRVGRLSMRFGPRYFMGIGPLVCALATLWMRSLSPGFSYWVSLLPAQLVFACGLSLIVAPLTSTVLADAGPGDAGIASGVNNAVARVASLLAIAVVGAAIAGAANQLDMPGYQLAMAITAGLFAAGGVTGLAAIRKVPAHAAAAEVPAA
jgi:EmrB/QacA subfamily drug resistance transporter